MTQSSLPWWLATLYLPAISTRKLLQCINHFPDIQTFFTAPTEEWRGLNLASEIIEALRHPHSASIERDMKWAQCSSHHIITFDDDAYPPYLKEIADPPLVLFVEGDPSILQKINLAVVGSRHATPMGLNTAEQFSYCLAEEGFVISSGLALGIDGAAHRGALTAKGMTIGVAGTGLLHRYPRSHAKLMDEMIEKKGAVISEFPLETPPKAMNFPQRNRIIAGLSIGIVVVEAALKSGSLITARYAVENGRDVFAIPGSIHHPLARGCHYLIRQGAKLVEEAKDIIEELSHYKKFLHPPVRSSLTPIKTNLNDLSDQYSLIFDQVKHEITPIDVIILRSGLTASEVSSILLTLELTGYIQSVPGGYIRQGK